MAKCPVCKEELSVEMLPFGKEPGKKGKKMKAEAIIPQVISWAIDTSLRAMVGSGRSLYLTCNNPECPCCWKPKSPTYFKNGALGPALVGDSSGLMLTFKQSQYTKKKKKE